MTKPRPRGLLAAWLLSLTLIMLATWQLIRAVAACGDGFLPFTADFLTAAAVYEDLFFDDYSLKGFQFSAATFAVPDVVTYFPVRALAGSVGAAMLPWQLTVYALLVGSAWYALAGVVPARAWPWTGPAVLLVTAAFLAALATRGLTDIGFQLLVPGCHAGAQTLAFVSAGLLVRYLDHGGGAKLATLAVVAMMAAFSDRLFAVYFPVPAFLALGAVKLAGSLVLSWQRILMPALAVALGCGVGLAGLKMLPNPGLDGDPLGSYWAGIEPGGLANRAGLLLEAAAAEVSRRDPLAIAAVAWFAFSLLLLARRLIGRSLPFGVRFYLIWSVLALAATGGVFLLSASADANLIAIRPSWGNFGRYFAGPFALGLYGWALLLACACGRGGAMRSVSLILTALMAALLIGLAAREPRIPVRVLFDPYPTYLRTLDEVCRARGLTHGFSSYFQAKEITYYSKAGLRVQAIGTDLNNPDPLVPSVWLSNALWLTPRPGEGPYTFVLAGHTGQVADLYPADVRRVFGPPAEEIPVGEFLIMVYDRPSDAVFRDYLSWNPEVNKARYRTNPRASLEMLGRGFQRDHPYHDVGLSRVAIAGDPIGRLAYGPLLKPRLTGWHAAEFRLRSSGDVKPNGLVSVRFLYPDNKTDVVLAGPIEVPLGYDGTLRVEFHLGRDALRGGYLYFCTHYVGTGRLEFEKVTFGRSQPGGETLSRVTP